MIRSEILVRSALILAASTSCHLVAPDSAGLHESGLRITATLADMALTNLDEPFSTR